MKVKLKHRRLAEELAKSRLSLNRWAQKMGLSSGHLSDLVNGKRSCPRPETRRKLLDSLGLSFEDLFRIEHLDTSKRSLRPDVRQAGPGNERKSLLVRPSMVLCDANRTAVGVGSVRQGLMGNMTLNIRYALRQFVRRPGFSLVAVATLTIGIASSTALFSMVNSILWKPFPYADPERMVRAYATVNGRTVRNFSFPEYWDLREDNQVFSAVAASDWEPFSLSHKGNAVRVGGGQVTADLFDVLGVQPLMGRTFTRQEDRPGGPAVVVLGENLWRNQFGADPGITGTEVLLNNRPAQIIGVMPASAEYPEFAELWVPLQLDPLEGSRGSRWLGIDARLKPGVDLSQAQAEVQLLGSRWAEEHPEPNRERILGVRTLRDDRLGKSQLDAITLVLVPVMIGVLLIACVNVANLLLARGVSREREIAIRSALGAGRGAVIRQLLTESLILAAAGGFLGILMGRWLTGVMLDWVPIPVPAWVNIDLDIRVTSFVILAAIVSAVIFGLAPALQAGKTDAGTSLREGGGHSNFQSGRRRLRGALVVSEVALSLVLLVGAGVMIKNVVVLSAIDPGFKPNHVLTAGMDMLAYVDSPREERIAVFERFLRRIQALPGVEAVGAVDRMPLKRSTNNTNVSAEGQSLDEARRNPFVIYERISPDYFAAMGIPVFQGASFSAGDFQERQIVISRSLAELFWPEEPAVGKRLKFGLPNDSEDDWLEVAGVVGDVRHTGMDDDPSPMVYLDYRQFVLGRMTWAIRTSGDPLALVPALRAAVREVDPNQPLHEVMTLREVVNGSLWLWRYFGSIFWTFAGVALALACLGIYGVTAYSVTERTQEMGIRMALGAGRDRVLRLVMRKGLASVAWGLVVGLPLGLGLAFVMSRVMAGIAPFEPLTVFLVLVLLVGVAVLAILLPALRASRADPITALRCD